MAAERLIAFFMVASGKDQPRKFFLDLI